ncbi:unnamed protein product [Camellia sinensis]
MTARCFSASIFAWGRSSFLSLTDLHDASKGFLANDTLIVEAKVNAISTVKNFSYEKVTRSLRDIPPAHYLLKIESFSLLSQLLLDVGMKNYESDIFEASGYKWKLSLYPNGDKQRKGKGHISLYLLIAETSNLPVGWEVNVSFKLFVYNHIQDKYLTFQDDVNGKVKRFHLMKTELGFPQLLPLGTFNDAANGYLIRDTCLFGAEVVVMNCTGRGECLTLLKKGLDITYTWKIDKFSSLVSKIHYSAVFTIGNQEWRVRLYPEGQATGEGKCLSLYLELDDSKSFPSERKTYAKYKLRIRNQIYSQHVEVTGTKCFSASTSGGWGNHSFLSFTGLHDASKGFLVKDTLIIEAEVSVLSTVNNLSKAYNLEEKGSSEVTRSLRDIPPSHYIFKIESFSQLSKALLDTEVQSYKSDIFEASGYKWRLSLYPNGDEKRNGKGYISLYLVIAETSKLPLAWEVNVNFKLFVYNQLQDKYLTIQEVFVLNYSGRAEFLSFKELDIFHTWKIEKFSSLDDKFIISDVFTAESCEWILCLFPKGSSEEKEKYLSLYSWLYNGEAFPPERKFYSHYSLCIRNQHNGKHKKFTGGSWLSATSHFAYGDSTLLSLTDLHDSSEGFLVNDTLIVRCKVIVVSEVKNFAQ